MDGNKNEEMSGEMDNWVMVNSCDIAEEAITLNKTADSDHESESSISIISEIATPNEGHSEEEAVPNNTEANKEEENLSISTRSSVEKIEISDEENYIHEANVSLLQPPLIKITKAIEPPLIVEDILDDKKDSEIKDHDNGYNETVNKHQSERTITFSMVTEEQKPPPVVCPRIIIQNVEKMYEYQNDNDSLPSASEGETDTEITVSLKNQLEESLMDIDEFKNDFEPMQYDRPSLIDDSDSWTDNDSSSDYMTQENQIVTTNEPHSRQEGITAGFSQNGLFIGAMFFVATALLKLYLLNENTDFSDENVFNYELNKLKEEYQSVDVRFNSHVRQDGYLETIVQFCTAKHGTNEDPYHRNNQRVDRCINKRTRKLNNEEETKKKKITLDMREKLLEIRERELQKREQELMDRLNEKQNLKAIRNDEISGNFVDQLFDKQHSKKDKDYLKELRKIMHNDEKNNLKFNKKVKIEKVDGLTRKKKFEKVTTNSYSSNDKEKFYDKGKNKKISQNYEVRDDVLIITEENDPIKELNEKISNTDIYDNTDNNIVTFKEIALAFREKELVRKLQEYNDNLENRINDIVSLRPKKKKETTNSKAYTSKEKINSGNNKEFLKRNEDKKTKLSSKEKLHKNLKDAKQERKIKPNYSRKLNSKAGDGKNKIKMKKDYLKNDHLKTGHNSENKEYQFNDKKPITLEPTQEFKNRKQNIMKNFKKFKRNNDYRKSDLKDELYIKYNPIKDTIDIVNISKSDDKNFILLKNGNKTVNGQWYINLHHARNILRSKEKSADWYFDRVLFRELKRNKAKWYFDYMSGRQNTRECFI